MMARSEVEVMGPADRRALCFSGETGYSAPTMVVRMRRNRSQTAKRRSHHGLTAAKPGKCECGALKLSHRACATCGKYRGKVVVDVVARAKREAARTKRREKALRAAGESTGEKKEDK